MPAVFFVMLIILVLALGVIALVVMGMEGQGRDQHPEVAHALAKTAKHLNGEADPPRGLVAFFEEAEDGAEDLRALPDRLRSRASARSAASARTAASARSAASPDSASPAAPQGTPDAAAAPGTHTDTWADFSTAPSVPVQEVSDDAWSQHWDDRRRGSGSTRS